MSDQNSDAIRRAAYRKWEAAGCPDGRDLEFWLEAERETDEARGVERIVQGETAANDRPLAQPKSKAPEPARPVAKSTGIDKAAVERVH